MSVSVAVIYHHEGSHIDHQTQALIEGIGSEQVKVRAFDIDQALANLDALDDFDGFVFSEEAREGSPSPKMQSFMRSSADKGRSGAWLNKTATAYTQTGKSCTACLTTLIPFSLFCAQLNMVWISPEGVSETPSEATVRSAGQPQRYPSVQLTTAGSGSAARSEEHRPYRFGRTMAQATKRWCSCA